MVDEYVDVKNGRKQASYLHPVLKEVLEETYGVMVYQEQVMRIFNRLGGIELSQAYGTIKAISKKKADVIAKSRDQFVRGAVAQGLEREKSAKIFELIEYFGGYGFNKSHSTAYALVAYQTAYLKAHYPTEFMAAVLSSEMDGAERDKFFVEHIDDCRRMGIEVLPPNINEGQLDFRVAGEGKILLRAGGDQGRRVQGRRGDRQGAGGEGAVPQPRRLLRAGLDQGSRRRLRRDPDPRRRVRLPRGTAIAAPGDPAPGHPGRPGQAGRPPPRPARALRRARIGRAASRPATATATATSRRSTPARCPRAARRREARQRKEGARLLHVEPSADPPRRAAPGAGDPPRRRPGGVAEKTEVVLGGMITNVQFETFRRAGRG